MTLAECGLGDLVLVRDPRTREDVVVQVGAIAGLRVNKNGDVKGKPSMALVTTWDIDADREVADTWRSMPHDTEVIDVVDTAARRRRARFGGVIDVTAEKDPLAGAASDGW